ncbi:COPII coat assembly protein sec16 [Cytospora mali]|uniref:Protein transport protein sec16 n=1 Tax=Cytospora mali TaxID=578113 RepID=A0A194W6D1_CYTMA|nr:COPII coat assembly protein sec16 [Valsa mali]
MSSDAPTAAWHPAMMPNLHGDTEAGVDAVLSDNSYSPSPEETADSQSDSIPPPQPIGTSETHEHTPADEWFPDYEAGTPSIPKEEIPDQEQGQDQIQEQEAGSYPGPEPEPESVQEPESVVPEYQEEAPVEQQFSAEATDLAPVQHEAAEEEQSIPPSGSKHVSNESFARTVSHHPVWIEDDEEPEFNLPRAETDLFNKYMPPNERTNSFPVVPQSEHQEEIEVEPLPTNQAEDVIHEIEHQSESFEVEESSTSHAPNVLQQDSFWGDDDEEVAFITQGGDLQGPEEEASDARYAEGLPLINHHEAEEKEEPGKAQDLFSQDTAEDGDDFFNQIADGANSPAAHELSPGQLERKSTIQVLNGLGASDRTAGSVLQETVEEEDEQLDHAVERETTPAAAEDVPNAGPGAQATHKGQGEDLVAKWSEAFAGDDDDDFLLEDEVAMDNQGQEPDPSAFLVDDDEGFLEDTEEAPTSQPPAASTHANTANRYLPAAPTQPAGNLTSNPYLPSASPALLQPQVPTPLGSVPPAAANPYAVQPPPLHQTLSAPYGVVAQRPAVNKAQSFVDKSKGGYHSPYDLPMEVVKPRKRASHQQLPRVSANPASAPPPPPRSVSMYAPGSSTTQGPPAQAPPPAQLPPPAAPPHIQSFAPGVSPPPSNHSGQSPSLGTKPPQPVKPKTGFFEDLPLSIKVRPASRTSNKGQHSPSQPSFNGPQDPQPSTPSMPTPPQEPSVSGHSGGPDLPKLVPPTPGNPYASLPSVTSSAAAVPPPGASRYSPALSQGSMPNGVVPPPISRYSPAPPAQRTGATPPTALPHLPRTSSPLAHFEVSHNGARTASGDPAHHSGRNSSTSYEPRLNRMPSLPPTHEVEEEDPAAQSPAGGLPSMSSAPNLATQESQHGQSPFRTRQTPPPPPSNSYNTKSMSPPKRKITYGPAPTVIPPPRSQTGSPGAMYGLRSPIKPSEMVPRPLSAYDPSSPSIASMVSPPTTIPAPEAHSRPRGMSQKLNLIPPTDGREHDPLQRWKGCPLISWGSGGMVVTSFPVDVPRYGVNQPGPMIVRSPGEVKVKTIKDVQPLEERLAKFPGPLRGKSKKKETIAWLTAGIQELEKGLPNLAFPGNLSHDDRRAVERVLLWKILRIFIEHDGILEGNLTVDKAVRDVLSLTPTGEDEITSPIYASGNAFGGFAGESSATQMQPDSVDSGTIQQLKKALLGGEREKAVWDAADKRLWGHALLIANTVSPDLYHKVSQEFIKKEVNFPGHNNESLAALYAVLSGNYAESVDELVPVHARAGVQMVASSSGPTTGGVEGLEKWRETLTLVLSNRSTGDVQALQSLGNLLSEYGRAEAAHICFLFARNVAIFGGLDDQQAQFVLVGADHRKQEQQSFKETEALLLSEVYEYGLSLTGASAQSSGVAHLAVYKLQHAMTLAEYGYSDKALQYCDMLVREISAQTRRSPYHHLLLESAVEDLRQRILQAPNKDSSGSWISKPNMGKVSDSMWNRFNKFVAGDENDPAGPGSPKFGEESGPFARIQGGTPTISRPASASNATGMEMFGSPPNGYASGAPSLAPTMSPQMTRAPSRYSPLAAQPAAYSSPYEPNSAYAPTGRSSMERTSGEYNRGHYEPRRLSSDVHAGHTNSYTPSNIPAPTQNHPDPGLGISSQSSYQPTPLAANTSASFPPAQSSAPMTPGFSSYNPLSQTSSPYVPSAPYTPAVPAETNTAPEDNKAAPALGYQPPSYGHEPPSMEPAGNKIPQSSEDQAPSGGFEAPSYQPYGFEPPSYQPDPETNDVDGGAGDEAKPKKKSFMDDDDDDYFTSVASTKPQEKTKEERDKENEEMFRKVAEEEAKRAEAEKAAKSKKGWGLGSWFSGSKKESLESSPNKPIRAKLGEKSSFVYDPEQKRWVNKAAGAEDNAPKVSTPPPPRATPRPAGSGTPPPPGASSSAPPLRPGSTPTPSEGRFSPGPPAGPPGSAPPPLMRPASTASNAAGAAGGPPSAPPSRPTTSMSHASSIDDLLGAAVPRKGAAARNKKKGGGRYVDVMAK